MPLYVRLLWITVHSDDARDAVEGHRQHVKQLRQEGRLFTAGEFAETDGFLEIFEAKDLHAADATLRDSPLVEQGLCSWQLREWHEAAP